MRKTYKAKTILSVIVGNGRRISFEPTSDEGSMFATDNVVVQQMLEEHPWFGTKFQHDAATKRAMSLIVQKKPETRATATDGASAYNEDKKNPTLPAKQVEVQKIEVASLAEAKELLADRFGCMRTSLRTKKDIQAAARLNHVELVGI
jgi:hypothetical protein